VTTHDLGDFQLLSPLGSGGMGEVWRAVHRTSGVHVAIKWLRKGGAALEREIRVVARLCHPHVATVLDLGTTSDRTWFAMELADATLAEVDGDWPWLRTRLEQILAALAHAHARGVIHRDLKPANVLLVGSTHQVKLADFGISASVDRLGPRGGTPLYMPPEQIMNQTDSEGPWTDLYALGATTWELACGTAPFSAGTGEQIITSHLTKPLPDFEPRIAVPADLVTWLTHLLAKNPRDRPRCAAEALATLPRGSAIATGHSTREVFLAETVDVYIDRVELKSVGTAARTAPFDLLGWKIADTPIDDLARASPRLLALRTVPLIGRESERQALWEALAEVYATEEPRGVAITGAPGIGKTRLAEWLSTRAHESGAAVSRDGRDIQDADRPTVVILDDGDGDEHRARTLLRGRSQAILVVLVTDRISPALSAFGDVTAIQLAPLSDNDMARLVWELLHLEGGLPGEIVREAGGRPLYVTQLVAHWIDRGVLVRTERGFALSEPTPLPADAMWEARVEALFGNDNGAMRLAAMFGPVVDEATWGQACAIVGVEASTRRLEEAGLIERSKGTWSFRYLGLRTALLARGTPPALHQACADALADSADPHQLLARAEHLLGANRPLEALEQLLPVAWEAKIWGVKGPLGKATLTALQACGDRAPRELRVSSWNSLAVCYSSTGRFRESIEAAGTARELAKDPAHYEAVDALNHMADAHYRLGELERGEQLTREALIHAKGVRKAHAQYHLICIYRRQTRLEEAVAASEKLLAMEEVETVEANALSVLAWLHLQRGDPDAAREVNNRARQLAQHSTTFGTTAHLDNIDGEIARAAGFPEEAVRAYTAARDGLALIGSPGQCTSSANIGMAWLAVGVEHAEKARLAFESCDQRAAGFAPEFIRGVSAAGLAACHALAGRHERAADYLDRAEEILVRHGYFDPEVQWLLELAAQSDLLGSRVAAIVGRLRQN